MRLVLMTLFLAACLCHAEEPPASVQKAFRVRDASLDWYKAVSYTHLEGGVKAIARGLIGGFRVWQRDIEKQRGDAGVGEMRGDAGTHGSGSQNGDAANWFHEWVP